MKFQPAKWVFQMILFLGIGFLLMGAVVKKKDPLRETQTDPVGYQDKLKEEEGGKKGPPAPSLNLFPKEKFLVEGAVGKAPETASAETFEEQAAKEEFEDSDLWLEEEVREEEEFKQGEETDDTWEDSLTLDEESEEMPGKPVP